LGEPGASVARSYKPQSWITRKNSTELKIGRQLVISQAPFNHAERLFKQTPQTVPNTDPHRPQTMIDRPSEVVVLFPARNGFLADFERFCHGSTGMEVNKARRCR
jgi:hypothetical protein